jgi:hypothetical protein
VKKGLKITLMISGVVIGLPVLGFLGLMGYAVVQQLFFSLPTDGPRVITTADYDFTAPEGWLTSCTHEVPACLAVAPDPNVPSWKQRQEWIEVHPVEADGVINMDMLRDHAKPVAYQLAQNRIDADLQEVGFRGEAPDVWVYTIVNNAPSHYWRSDFVRLAPDRILRFTCFAQDYTHDEACTRGLAAVKFTGAIQASFARSEAEWKKQEEEKRAAQERAAAQRAERVAAQQTRTPAPAQATPGAAVDLDEAIRRAEEMVRTGVERQREYAAKENARLFAGPGWYVIDALQFGVALKSGKYDSEAACNQAKPPNDDDLGRRTRCDYIEAN